MALHGLSSALVLLDFFTTIVETCLVDAPAGRQLAIVMPLITYFIWIVDVMLFKFIVFIKVSSFTKLLKDLRTTEARLDDGCRRRDKKNSILGYLPFIFMFITIVSSMEENFFVYLKLHSQGLNESLFQTIVKINKVSDLIYPHQNESQGKTD